MDLSNLQYVYRQALKRPGTYKFVGVMKDGSTIVLRKKAVRPYTSLHVFPAYEWDDILRGHVLQDREHTFTFSEFDTAKTQCWDDPKGGHIYVRSTVFEILTD